MVEYDRLGRVTNAVTSVSSNRFAFAGLDPAHESLGRDEMRRDHDALGRVAVVGVNAGGGSSYWYHEWPLGYSVRYAYDGFGRLAVEADPRPLDEENWSDYAGSR